MKKILFGSILFVILYNLLFYPTVIGIGLGFLFTIFNIYLFVLRNKESKMPRFPVFLSALSILFAFLLGWRANEVVQALDFLFAIFLTIAAGYFYKKKELFSHSVFSFVMIPFLSFVDSMISLKNFFSEQKSKKISVKPNLYGSILRGFLLAIPILFLLWLSCLLLILLIATLRKTRQKSFFFAVFSITVAAFLSINIVPIDALIATKYPPTINHQIDTIYLMNLSSEAASTWPGFVQSSEIKAPALISKKSLTIDEYNTLSDMLTALYSLKNNVYYLERKYGKSADYIVKDADIQYASPNFISTQKRWQAFNYSEYQAYRLIQKNTSLFQGLTSLSSSISQRLSKGEKMK